MLLPLIKPKLARELAFPVGTEIVNQFVAETEAGFPVKLWFRDRATPSKTQFQALLDSRVPYTVVEAQFTRWDKAANLGDQHAAELAGYWTVTVRPVPSPEKPHVKALLVDHGLPALSAWMTAPRGPAWYHGQKKYEVVVDVWNRQLRLVETEIKV